jgi:hypothetical protein
MAATTDFAEIYLDGFENRGNIDYNLGGNAPTYSSTQSYGGQVALLCTTDSGWFSLDTPTAYGTNADGESQGSMLIDFMFTTPVDGGPWYFASIGSTTTSVVSVGITSDSKLVVTQTQAPDTQTGTYVMSANTWYMIDLWTEGGGDYVIYLRAKDATGTQLDTLSLAGALATGRDMRNPRFGKHTSVGGAATVTSGVIWLDNLVFSTKAPSTSKPRLFEVCSKGTNMVGEVFPDDAGYVAQQTAGTYIDIDDWITGPYATDFVQFTHASSNDQAGASFSVTSPYSGTGFLYGILPTIACVNNGAGDNMALGYGLGSTPVVTSSTRNCNDSNVLWVNTSFMVATDIVSSNDWNVSAITNMEAYVLAGTPVTSNGTLEVMALSIRYWGALVAGGGGSYGFILGCSLFPGAMQIGEWVTNHFLGGKKWHRLLHLKSPPWRKWLLELMSGPLPWTTSSKRPVLYSTATAIQNRGS